MMKSQHIHLIELVLIDHLKHPSPSTVTRESCPVVSITASPATLELHLATRAGSVGGRRKHDHGNHYSNTTITTCGRARAGAVRKSQGGYLELLDLPTVPTLLRAIAKRDRKPLAAVQSVSTGSRGSFHTVAGFLPLSSW